MKTLTNTHLSQARTILNKLALGITVSTLLGGCLSAQETADASSALADVTTSVTYSFQTHSVSGDTFTQLLGVNKEGTIVGYHGIGGTEHPFRGFVLTLPKLFNSENVPRAAQTQVTGINDSDETSGFFIDNNNVNHGFLYDGVRFKQVDFPGTTFNQLLGVNNFSQAAGYYADSLGIDHAYILDRFGNVFLTLTIPNSQGGSQATGINDSGSICGFYIDSKNVNHGFLLLPGHFKTLDFPGSTFTQALGVNKNNEVVGTYNDQAGLMHGFLYTDSNEKYQSIDDPEGVGTTTVNGINENGEIVGFYLDGNKNTQGFVGTPNK